MTSRDYWRQREEENLRRNLKTEAEYARELNRIYTDAVDSIQKEINAFYGRYADKEGITIAEAKKRVSKLDIEAYSRKAERYVKEKNFSKQANAEMRIYNLTMKVNRLEMLKAQIGLELVSSFDEIDRMLGEKLTERATEEFERQAGILGESVGDVSRAAASIVGASFHNATFSQRIWANQDVLRSEISRLLQKGMIQGKHSDVLARELRKSFDTSRYESERLMRTEMARVQTQAQMQALDRYGIEEYEYMACPNGDICEACKALDGKHFKTKDAMPGENAPPMHPNCHCATCAYLDEEKYSQWLDTYKDHGLGFKEWQVRGKDGIINIDVDELVPCLKDAKTGKILDTEVERMKKKDLSRYTKKNNWNVDWGAMPKDVEVYGLHVKGSKDVEGLVGIRYDQAQQAVYLHWASTAPHNNKLLNDGEQKYVGVGGHLFAIAAEKSIEKGYDGFMYGFAANSRLVKLYEEKFGAELIGALHPYHIIIDENAARRIMEEYNYEWKK